MRTITLFMTSILALPAQVQPQRVPWNRTPEAFAGKHVIVHLTNGAKIDGYWISVTPETFTMTVVKTSDRNAVAKGLRTLPKSSIVTLSSGKQRARGRVIGTVAGFYGVALAGYAITRQAEALQGGIGLAALVGAIAGFFVGRASDHATEEIALLP